MAEQVQATRRRKKERSPSYPGIDLETALERARKLREAEGRHFAPVAAVLEHWGYTPKSSSGLVTLAALKKFGLIDDQGSGDARQVRVSTLAQRILMDDREDSPERLRLIQEAALTPSIHAELWAEFSDSLPSDRSLSYKLRSERGFTDTAVGEFIDQFKRTIAFAKLGQSDTMSGHEDDVSPRESEDDMTAMPANPQADRKAPPPPPSDSRLRQVLLPLLGPDWATLYVPYPLSEAEWDHMLAVLKMFKPSLVPSNSPEPQPATQERTGPATQ